MRKIVKWLSCVVGITVVVAVILWSAARLSGPTAPQQEALSLLQQPWEPSGRNAFPAFWQLAYDVPVHEQAAIAQEDLRRMAATATRPAPVEGTDMGLSDYDSVAKGRYPDLKPSAADQQLFCTARGPECLGQVRAAQPAYEALIDRHERLLGRVASLAGYDHYRNPLPARMGSPMPPVQATIAPMTRHAVAFLRGDVDVALADTCRDITTWRRLGANADSLLIRMIGISYSTDGYGQLLAEMLAELASDHPLPASCAPAVAPLTPEELDLCNAMRGEFAWSSAMMQASGTPNAAQGGAIGRLLTSVLFDPDATAADNATSYAAACSEKERQRMATDATETGWSTGHGLARLQCAGNPVGCILTDSVGLAAYSDYALRTQDQGARFKVLATLLWLRQHVGDGRTVEILLSERPAELRSPTREIEVGKDGRSLRIHQYDTKRAAYWSIPLPRELWRSG